MKGEESADTINLFMQISGGDFESMGLVLLKQVLEKHKEKDIHLLLIESIYLSPYTKNQLHNLQHNHPNLHSIEYLNYPWPPHLPREFTPERSFIFYRTLFLDQMFPRTYSKLLYLDAD